MLKTLPVLRNLFNYKFILKLPLHATSNLINAKQIQTYSSILKSTNINSVTIISNRFKSKSKINNQNNDNEEEGEDSDDDDGDEDEEEIDSADIEELNLRKGYKVVNRQVGSLRYDLVLSAGLTVSRKKIEEHFYGSKLRLNNEKVLKKGIKVKESDQLDMLTKNKDGVNIVKRVIIHKVYPQSSKVDKPKVCMIAWRGGFIDPSIH